MNSENDCLLEALSHLTAAHAMLEGQRQPGGEFRGKLHSAVKAINIAIVKYAKVGTMPELGKEESPRGKKSGGGRKKMDPKMQQRLTQQLIEERQQGIRREGKALQEFCRDRAKKYCTHPDFIASKGWYTRFKVRFEKYLKEMGI